MRMAYALHRAVCVCMCVWMYECHVHVWQVCSVLFRNCAHAYGMCTTTCCVRMYVCVCVCMRPHVCMCECMHVCVLKMEHGFTHVRFFSLFTQMQCSSHTYTHTHSPTQLQHNRHTHQAWRAGAEGQHRGAQQTMNVLSKP